MTRHDWSFHAVAGESGARAVVICRTCGEGRYQSLVSDGKKAVPLGGECPGESEESPKPVDRRVHGGRPGVGS